MNEGSLNIEVFRETEVAEMLHMTPISLYRARKAGQISYRRVAQKILYTRSDIDQYLERLKRPAVAQAA